MGQRVCCDGKAELTEIVFEESEGREGDGYLPQANSH
jgi:hypothetical protein